MSAMDAVADDRRAFDLTVYERALMVGALRLFCHTCLDAENRPDQSAGWLRLAADASPLAMRFDDGEREGDDR